MCMYVYEIYELQFYVYFLLTKKYLLYTNKNFSYGNKDKWLPQGHNIVLLNLSLKIGDILKYTNRIIT